MNKHISTAAAAIALVSAIGLAYAQTSDTTTQSLDPNAPAQVQQKDAQQAVNDGTTATPDWRTPTTNDANAPTPAPAPDTSTMPADQSAATSTTDNSATTPAAPAATDNNSMSSSTDNSSTAVAPSTDTSNSSGSMITERAPQADRN